MIKTLKDPKNKIKALVIGIAMLLVFIVYSENSNVIFRSYGGAMASFRGNEGSYNVRIYKIVKEGDLLIISTNFTGATKIVLNSKTEGFAIQIDENR